MRECPGGQVRECPGGTGESAREGQVRESPGGTGERVSGRTGESAQGQ